MRAVEEAVIPQKKRQAATTPAKKTSGSPQQKRLRSCHTSKESSCHPWQEGSCYASKKTVTPAKAVVTPGKKGSHPRQALSTTSGRREQPPQAGSKERPRVPEEDRDEEDDEGDGEEEGDDEEGRKNQQ